jgi:hypothetical protein
MFGSGLTGGDDERLAKRLMQGFIEEHVGGVAGDDEGQSHDADVGVAGFGDAKGVRDVLSVDQSVLHIVEDRGGLEGLSGGETVGRVRGVGDGDPSIPGIGQLLDGIRQVGDRR